MNRLLKCFRLLLIWGLLSLSGSFALADSEGIDRLGTRENITFVLLNNHYPYSFIDETGKVDGVIAEYAKLFISRGVAIDYLFVESHREANQALLEGKGDVFPFQAHNPDISEQFLLSQPYIPFQHALIQHSQSNQQKKSEGYRVALINERNEPYKPEQTSETEFIYYETIIDALRAIDKNEVRAVFSEPIFSIELANHSGIDNLSVNFESKDWRVSEAAMKVSKDNSQLLQMINRVLSEVTPDNQNHILSKWLGMSPYRTSVSGIVGFGSPPYRYPQSPTIGLEFETLQQVFNNMGLQLANVQVVPRHSSKEALDSSDGLLFLSGVTRQEGKNYYSDVLFNIEYVLVSLKSRQLDVSQVSSLKHGVLHHEPSSLSYLATEKSRAELDLVNVLNIENLESGISLLRSQTIDTMLVESQAMEWFVANKHHIDRSELSWHRERSVPFPLYVEFKDEALRDRFNAALRELNNSNAPTELTEKHVNVNLSRIATKSEVIAQIIAYFIINDRISDIPQVLSLIDAEHSFSVIDLQVDSKPFSTWYLGDNDADPYRYQNTGLYSKIEATASYVTNDGVSNVGELTFYFDVDDIDESDNYYPDLELYSDLGGGVTQYIAKVYESNNLSGSLLNLTQAERDWILEQKEIRIGIDPNAMPYEALGKGDEFIGIVNDYLKIITQKTGLPIVTEPVNSWNETMRLADHGAVQLVSAAVENKTLAENYRNAKGLFSSRLAIASSRDERSIELGSVSGWKLGILKHASNTPNIVKRFPSVDWVYIDSTEDGLNRVSSGDLDGVIDTIHVLNYLININGYRDISIIGRLDYYVTPTFHVLKKEPLLLSILNKVIRSIPDSEHKRIEAKWSAPKSIEKINYQLVYTISGFSLLVLVLIVVWNRQLKKQVGIANKATEDLVEAQNELYAILNTSPIAAAVVVNDKVSYINDTAESLFKLRELNVAEFDVNKIYHSTLVRESIHKQLRDDGKVINKELSLIKSDGEVFTALVSYYLFNLGNQSATLFWAFDISEQKHLQESLEREKTRADEASKAKSEFLANMSHEIRTPMNAIIGLSHLAIGETDASVAQNYVKKVHRSGLSLLNIINDILDFSKIEAGELVVEKIPFQVTEPLKEVIELLQVKADEKGLELKTAWSSEVSAILLGDPLRLFQVTLNLVGNAIKFTQYGSVTLKAEYLESSDDQFVLKVTVIDTGIGIPKGKLAGLFKAFSQADSSTTRRFGGTGLGLNISQKLIQAMGGTIGVESQEGVGSQFSYQLTLPIASTEQVRQFHQAQVSESDDVRFSGEHILLAEDNELNQELAMAILEKLNLKADLVVNGQQALDKVAVKEYSLILMDIQMPVMDGIEATEQIRYLGSKTPIVAMSANVFSDVKQQALDVGINDFVDKPIRFEQFVKTLSVYLKPSLNSASQNHEKQNQNELYADIQVYSPELAIQYSNNDAALQEKLLSQFVSNGPKIFADIQLCYQQENEEGAEIKLHTLKSMASTIGGMKLAQILQESEYQAHNGSLKNSDIEACENALKELLDTLPTANSSSESEDVKRSRISADQIVHVRSLIETFDIQALAAVNELIEQSGPTEPLEMVQKALEQYDFELALKAISDGE